MKRRLKDIFTEKKSKIGGIHPSVSFGRKLSRKGMEGRKFIFY